MPSRPSLAVLMDPLETIKPAKDSTLAMLKAAGQRDCEVLVFGLGDLWSRDGRAFARLLPLTVTDDAVDWYRTGEPEVRELGSVDAILMRKDPPFDMEYVCATYLLERAELAGAMVVNRPQGLRDMNEKVYTAWFPDCCPPTLVSRDMGAMEAFLVEQGQAVFKPLDGMGGRSIFVVERGDRNARVVLETLTDYGRRYAIAQRYLPEIAETGDARILIVDGEPVPHALVRMPAAGDHRGNLAAGATAESRELTERDRWLASRIGPALRERGMLFVGLDVIGGFVTEINVTSPTGIREIEKKHGHDVGGMLVDAALKRLGRS
jgi:glutathione synthase